MRNIIYIFKKSFIQQLRDPVSLLITLLTTPFLLFVYWMFCNFSHAENRILFLVRSSGKATTNELRSEIHQKLEELGKSKNGQAFRITTVDSEEDFRRRMRIGDFTAGIIIPEKVDMQHPVIVTGNGDRPGLLKTEMIIKELMISRMTKPGLLKNLPFRVEPMGISGKLTSFDYYVPGLLVFSIIILIFSIAMSFAREAEAKVILRMKMTGLHAYQYVIGMVLIQFINASLALIMSFFIARLLGFKSSGSLVNALLIAQLACIATISLGVCVGSMARNSLRAFLYSSILMFLLILFSGIIFPQPRIVLFAVNEHRIGLFDLLPTTHLAKGFRLVFNLGCSLPDLTYEIVFLMILSLIYLVIGILCFKSSFSSKV